MQFSGSKLLILSICSQCSLLSWTVCLFVYHIDHTNPLCSNIRLHQVFSRLVLALCLLCFGNLDEMSTQGLLFLLDSYLENLWYLKYFFKTFPFVGMGAGTLGPFLSRIIIWIQNWFGLVGRSHLKKHYVTGPKLARDFKGKNPYKMLKVCSPMGQEIAKSSIVRVLSSQSCDPGRNSFKYWKEFQKPCYVSFL